jgi:hypothetical protein
MNQQNKLSSNAKCLYLTLYLIMKTQVKWKKLLAQTLVWLATEIYLNFLGIDNLADYSEFLYDNSRVQNHIYGDRLKLKLTNHSFFMIKKQNLIMFSV